MTDDFVSNKVHVLSCDGHERGADLIRIDPDFEVVLVEHAPFSTYCERSCHGESNGASRAGAQESAVRDADAFLVHHQRACRRGKGKGRTRVTDAKTHDLHVVDERPRSSRGQVLGVAGKDDDSVTSASHALPKRQSDARVQPSEHLGRAKTVPEVGVVGRRGSIASHVEDVPACRHHIGAGNLESLKHRRRGGNAGHSCKSNGHSVLR